MSQNKKVTQVPVRADVFNVCSFIIELEQEISKKLLLLQQNTKKHKKILIFQ